MPDCISMRFFLTLIPKKHNIMKAVVLYASLLLSVSSASATSEITEVKFIAQPGISKVDLIWTNLAKEEVSAFTIERSKDGELWAEILTVQPIGQSEQNERFMESDFHPLNGVSFYRLKKKLSNGLYAYSHIITVKNNVVYNDNGEAVNPTVDLNQRDFSTYSNEEVLVTLKDQKGEEYFSRVYVLEENNETILVDIDNTLLAGNYVITSCSNERLVSLNATVK